MHQTSRVDLDVVNVLRQGTNRSGNLTSETRISEANLSSHYSASAYLDAITGAVVSVGGRQAEPLWVVLGQQGVRAKVRGESTSRDNDWAVSLLRLTVLVLVLDASHATSEQQKASIPLNKQSI